MNFENREEVTIPEYIEMIRLKTAVLLGGALKIGALIGEASETDTQHLYNFGEKLGIACQLQDDILDVYGDPEKFGKQVGGDIISNKKTFLLIKALELAKGDDLKDLNQWLSVKYFNAEEKVIEVSAIYDNLGIKALSENKMQAYAELTLKELKLIKVDKKNKEILMEFAEMLVGRDK